MLAHPIGRLRAPLWSMWDHSPIVIGGCILVLAVYLRGYWRRRAKAERVNVWRAISYVSGVLLTYLVLQSPMDALADHIFWIHRIQHVVLHHWIPMLLALAAPIPELVLGLPRWARLYVLRPILRNRGVRGTWSFIQHPVVAPMLFVGLIYFWLTPSMFQYATLNQNVHDIMHVSMLAEGIPFWWLMLSPRPGRVSYGKRLIILWAIMLPQILAGAYITFTPKVLYPLYAIADQGWVSSYIRDQRLGGLVVWIPASMMSAVAGLIVIRWWIRQVRQSDAASRRARVTAAPPLGRETVVDGSS
ncbi:MAG: cytochrome c oxidase assembly protein [Steroidobacteraceae bacterium]